MAQKFVIDDSDDSGNIAEAVNNAKNVAPKYTELTEDQKKGIGYGREQQVLAMTRMLLPIVDAMIANPGTAASVDERVDTISKIIDASFEVSSVLADRAYPIIAQQTWAKKQTFELVAKYISSQWEKHGELRYQGLVDAINAATISVDNRSLGWIESRGSIPLIKNEKDAVSRIRLSTIKSVAPVMESVQDFSFWIEKIDAKAKDKMIKSIVDRVNELVASTANDFSDQNGLDDEQRIMLWQSLISRAYSISNSEYKRLKIEVTNKVNNEPDPALRASIRKQWAKDGVSHVVGVVIERTKLGMATLFGLSNSMSDIFERTIESANKPDDESVNESVEDEKTDILNSQSGHSVQKP